MGGTGPGYVHLSCRDEACPRADTTLRGNTDRTLSVWRLLLSPWLYHTKQHGSERRTVIVEENSAPDIQPRG